MQHHTRVVLARCLSALFWRVVLARCFGALFWRVVLARCFGALFWQRAAPAVSHTPLIFAMNQAHHSYSPIVCFY
jgi:hypothetical protein